MSQNVMVVLGVTGDLNLRKLFPAIFHLFCQQLLPADIYYIGMATRKLTQPDFFKHISSFVEPKGSKQEGCLQELGARCSYISGDFQQDDCYLELREQLTAIAGAAGIGSLNILYYVATIPMLCPTILDQLAANGLGGKGVAGHGYRRIVLEKPIGSDLESARLLNQKAAAAFREDQTFRIDHYLAKETVQNILAFRFANTIFEPIWNRNYIDNIQISVSETLGVGSRGRYFEGAGILRDIVQNHLLQLVSLVAMEPPAAFRADQVRNEKYKVFESIRPLDQKAIAEQVIRAQYQAGAIGGHPARSYLDEAGVASDSVAETFVSLPLYIDTWRWAGVPFFLRAGKRMATRCTEIVIEFRTLPLNLFCHLDNCYREPNMLYMHIQPKEGMTLKIGAKKPGAGMVLEPVDLSFDFNDFDVATVPAYERLILDAIKGDLTLFARRDSVEACWQVIDPIEKYWRMQGKSGLHSYPAGSLGPAESDQMIWDCGRSWHKIDGCQKYKDVMGSI